ncbi:MAG: lamin tail domain-containing protein [Verrucomicrobiota bacterium]
MNHLFLLLALALSSVPVGVLAQENVITNGSTWRWRPGTNEASTPFTAWRTNGFNDSTWLVGTAPFSYGTNATGRDEGLTSGTVVSNMINNFSGIFLRRTFVITNVAEVQSVAFNTYYDDGFVAWINGVPVLQQNMPTNSPVYTNFALVAHEADPVVLLTATNSPQNYLVVGTNTLAVQLFNNQIASSDLRFETALQITKVGNAGPPVITNVSPAVNATLGTLTQITVSFDQPVYGVDTADLLVNNQPASSVSGLSGTNRYTFTFTQPLPGLVAISWDALHGIADLDGNAFDADASNATWSYTLTDTLAPQVIQRTPVPGGRVSRLTQVELSFNEPVEGVNAADLLVNGLPATNVTGSGTGPYRFQFPQPAAGAVQFAWSAAHSITDLATVPNAFLGGSWTNILDPAYGLPTVRINEFLAVNVNTNGLRDEFGNLEDWIELYNFGVNAVDLAGCSLTDDANLPGKWVFPSVMLGPNQYLVVFASGLNRAIVGGTNNLHTSFSLDTGGEYLGLFNAESPRTPLDEFSPAYPEQRMDISFGRDSLNALRHFNTPTPGAPNGSSTITGVVEAVHFTVERGFFNQPFTLLLTTPTPGATIRYTTDGSPPTDGTGSIYSSALTVSNTTILRAAAFKTDLLPTLVETHTYIFPASVLNQPAAPPGFPLTGSWGNGGPDYEMDPEVVTNPSYSATIQGDLLSIPTLSLVLTTDDMFGPANGVYSHVSGLQEAPCSMELFYPDGTKSLQLDAGVEMHGGGSRTGTRKHSLGIKFRGQYGYGKMQYQFFTDSPVEAFDSLVLHADYNNHWVHSDATQRPRGGLVRDAFIKDTQAAMGSFSSHSRYVHLYINGLYWGVYNPCEDLDKSFCCRLFRRGRR